MQDEGDGDEDARPAPKRAARRNSDALPHGLSQAASAELGADADAPGPAAKQVARLRPSFCSSLASRASVQGAILLAFPKHLRTLLEGKQCVQ